MGPTKNYPFHHHTVAPENGADSVDESVAAAAARSLSTAAGVDIDTIGSQDYGVNYGGARK